MTIYEAITASQDLTGAIIDDSTMVRWLSDVDGKLTVDFFKEYNWEAYTDSDKGTAESSKELIVPHPWDELYVFYLEAMTYYTNGEYDRYNNAMTMFNNALTEYKKYYRRTHRACPVQ